MNSLGLEYGSSSDGEDAVAHATSPSPSSNPAPPAAVEENLPKEPTVSPIKAPAESEDKTPEHSVSTAAPTGPEAFQSEEDLEKMLQNAGIPTAVASLETDNEIQERIARFLRVQRERGQDFQTTLQDKKEVRNPYILEKVVDYFHIDELQSNFSQNVFDPHGLPLHEYSDALALEQKKRADAQAQRQLQQKPRQLQFVASDPSFSSRG